MASIRSRDTKPEIAVRHYLHRAGFRFRLHRRDLPGTPDITLPRYRTVVFVHGCFWHQHLGCCKHRKIPRHNSSYWGQKLRRNVARDVESQKKLKKMGWRVLVIWECQIAEKTLLRLATRIRKHGKRSGLKR